MSGPSGCVCDKARLFVRGDDWLGFGMEWPAAAFRVGVCHNWHIVVMALGTEAGVVQQKMEVEMWTELSNRQERDPFRGSSKVMRHRPRGPMDKASAYGAGDCRFEPAGVIALTSPQSVPLRPVARQAIRRQRAAGTA